jgi:hypothetical protein
MPAPVIPDDVLRLLNTELQGYAQLETLLSLSARPDRGWTVAELSSELGVGEEEVEQALSGLVKCELARGPGKGGTYQYETRDDARARTVAALREFYQHHPIEVVRIMNRNAIERVRNSATRAFADAFLLGKKNDG